MILIQVNKKFRKKIGKLGIIEFEKGVYVYVGSAMGKAMSIENRISRHLRKNKKLKLNLMVL